MQIQERRTDLGEPGNMQLRIYHRKIKNSNIQSQGLPRIPGQTDHKEKQQSIGHMKRRDGKQQWQQEDVKQHITQTSIMGTDAQ